MIGQPPHPTHITDVQMQTSCYSFVYISGISTCGTRRGLSAQTCRQGTEGGRRSTPRHRRPARVGTTGWGVAGRVSTKVMGGVVGLSECQGTKAKETIKAHSEQWKVQITYVFILSKLIYKIKTKPKRIPT